PVARRSALPRTRSKAASDELPPADPPPPPPPPPPQSPASSSHAPSRIARPPRHLRRRVQSVSRSLDTPSLPDDIPAAAAAVRFDDPPRSPRRAPNPAQPPRTEPDSSATSASNPPPADSAWPTRRTYVSPRTASAILWVLEEAIRKPYPFSPVRSEINASMSELTAEGLPSASHSRQQQQQQQQQHNGGTHRPSQPPAPPNPAQSGVRTPTDIMRQRRDREARKRAEQEAREREQQEMDRIKKQQDQEQRKADRLAQEERRKPVAADPQIPPTRRPGAASASRPPDVPLPQNPSAADHPPAARPPPEAHSSRRAGDGPVPEQPARQRAPGASSHQPRPSQARGPDNPAQNPPTAQAPKTQSGQAAGGSGSQAQGQSRRSFPHAFERWEMLSSHWEGLTSYWIRRLEQNNEDLSKDPLSQQMSRQITDLSAAGANLFHAVVELQRLRASSERKFQRWFFDTRAEQERFRELQAELHRQLETERLGRDEAISTAKQAEVDKAKAEELVREMRRELQISRDEARRAWEELGRREHEERERTMSLRNGEPTVVGGVQVVPMVQAYPGRHTSSNRPQTREGPYPGGPGATFMGGYSRRDEQSDQYSYDSQVSTPRAGDQFSESTSRDQSRTRAANPMVPLLEAPPSSAPATTNALVLSSKAPAAQGAASGFYQHDSAALHKLPTSGTSGPEGSHVPTSEAGASEASEEYEPRMNHPDFPGRQLSYPRTVSDDSDDYENQEIEQDDAEAQQYDQRYPPGSSAEEGHDGYRPGPVDYSGSGWGPTWESMAPRHRHPTRLSDVIEEDERSRTSPSRASQASRGMP
ncbi:hypothetical protein LOZ10_006621, partial [Ophidiomyces ophidiicola]